MTSVVGGFTDRLAEIKSLNWKRKLIPSRTGNHPSSTELIIAILSIATFPQPVKETAKICSLCSPMQRYSLLPASASTPQSSSSSRMWRLMSRTDTELSGLQRPKPENPCMSVKASTMHDSMCFAKAVICSGNWLTASCATTKVPISNLRGAIVSRAQQRADPNAVCAQFSKTISKRSVFL